MSALHTLALPVQPRETFVCPSWCVVAHDRSELSEWDYGQWLVTHEGEPVQWDTARGTPMTAHLAWTEIVGSSPVVVEDHLDLSGPCVRLGGDDGSGFMGTHEIVAADWPAWRGVLDRLYGLSADDRGGV